MYFVNWEEGTLIWFPWPSIASVQRIRHCCSHMKEFQLKCCSRQWWWWLLCPVTRLYYTWRGKVKVDRRTRTPSRQDNEPRRRRRRWWGAQKDINNISTIGMRCVAWTKKFPTIRNICDMAWPALQAPAASAETGLVTGQQHREQTDRDTPARLLLSPVSPVGGREELVVSILGLRWNPWRRRRMRWRPSKQVDWGMDITVSKEEKWWRI